MRNLRISLVLLTVIVFLVFVTSGSVEAGSRPNGRDFNQHSRSHSSQSYNSQSYNSKDRSCSSRQPALNYKTVTYAKHNHNRNYVKHHVHCVERRPVRYVVKPECRPHQRHHGGRYLYPALIGAGVGLLVLGLTR